MNQPIGTHFSTNVSVLDLSILLSNLTFNYRWERAEDTYDSDHFPFITTIYTLNDINPTPSPSRTRRNFKKANWKRYGEMLTQIFCDRVDLSVEDFLSNLQYVANLTILKNRTSSNDNKKQHLKNAPWWDAECTQLICQRKMALDRYKQSPSIENFLNAKKASALTRRQLCLKKKNSFREFCHSLNRSSHISLVWDKIKRFRYGFKPNKTFHRIPLVLVTELLNNLPQRT